MIVILTSEDKVGDVIELAHIGNRKLPTPQPCFIKRKATREEFIAWQRENNPDWKKIIKEKGLPPIEGTLIGVENGKAGTVYFEVSTD